MGISFKNLIIKRKSLSFSMASNDNRQIIYAFVMSLNFPFRNFHYKIWIYYADKWKNLIRKYRVEVIISGVETVAGTILLACMVV